MMDSGMPGSPWKKMVRLLGAEGGAQVAEAVKADAASDYFWDNFLGDQLQNDYMPQNAPFVLGHDFGGMQTPFIDAKASLGFSH